MWFKNISSSMSKIETSKNFIVNKQDLTEPYSLSIYCMSFFPRIIVWKLLRAMTILNLIERHGFSLYTSQST